MSVKAKGGGQKKTRRERLDGTWTCSLTVQVVCGGTETEMVRRNGVEKKRTEKSRPRARASFNSCGCKMLYGC